MSALLVGGGGFSSCSSPLGRGEILDPPTGDFALGDPFA